MRRRAFFSAFGFGTAATVVSGVAVAKGASPHPEKRDLQWAKARTAEGHRVRLESWCVPIRERDSETAGPDAVTIHMGSAAGLASLDACAVTVGMLDGPWEIVPQEDYPKPPKPVVWDTRGRGGDITIRSGDASPGGSVSINVGSST
jgi:hypothetical protein